MAGYLDAHLPSEISDETPLKMDFLHHYNSELQVGISSAP